MSSDDDYRILRDRHADDLETVANLNRGHPDREISAYPSYSATVPVSALVADGSPIVHRCSMVGLNGFSVPTIGINPASAMVTYVDAPPPPRSNPLNDSLIANRKARLIDGRWIAATKRCKCGPCHPRKNLTLAITYLSQTGLVSTTLALTYYTVPANGVNFFDTTHAPYIAPSPAYGWYGRLYLPTFGIGTFSYYGAGEFGYPSFYHQHHFLLQCVDGGYTLCHEMNNLFTKSGTAYDATGYRMFHRGVNRSCKPFELTFASFPDTWEAVDLRASYLPGTSQIRYQGTPSGLHRLPNYYLADGLIYPSVDTRYAPFATPVNAWEITPAFGVQSLGITG